MFYPKKILVPTDFSEDSDEALKQAMELAHQYNAKVYLLHVNQPVVPCAGDYCLSPAEIQSIEEKDLHEAREMMRQELVKVSQWQDIEIEVVSDVREGDPVSEILKEENEKGVDLIIMPSHKKTGLMKRLLGHISEKVMEEARSPVMLVHH